MEHRKMSSVEELAPHVTREFLQDGRIVVFSLKSVSRNDVDTYAYYLNATSDDYPTEAPFCLIQDFSELPTLTPYVRQMIDDVVTHFQEKFPAVYVAVLVQPSIYGRITSNFVQRDLDSPSGGERRILANRDEALNWLGEVIEANS
jgi:hypothetical protein